MPARKVKTYKKELGHRMHRDHRTNRTPGNKRQIKLRSDYRKKKERIIVEESEGYIQNYKRV